MMTWANPADTVGGENAKVLSASLTSSADHVVKNAIGAGAGTVTLATYAPAPLADGGQPAVANVGGFSTQNGLSIAVKN